MKLRRDANKKLFIFHVYHLKRKRDDSNKYVIYPFGWKEIIILDISFFLL